MTTTMRRRLLPLLLWPLALLAARSALLAAAAAAPEAPPTKIHHVPMRRLQGQEAVAAISSAAALRGALEGGDGNNKAVLGEALSPQRDAVNAYVAELSFDGQPLQVLVDTGSVNLVVPSLTCRGCFPSGQRGANMARGLALDLEKAQNTLAIPCGDAACKGSCSEKLTGKVPDSICSPNGGLCQTLSSTAGTAEQQRQQPALCLFYDAYGLNATAAGVLVTGPVAFGGQGSPAVPTIYGVISEASPTFGATGIVGMGMGNGCNTFSCYPAFMETLMANKVIDQDVFAFCGNKDAPVLVLGGGDPRLHTGELTKTPMQEPFDYYTVGIDSMSVGGEVIDAAANAKGFIDTGTSGIVFPKGVYDQVKALMQSGPYCKVPCLCPSQDAAAFQRDCNNLTLFEAGNEGVLVQMTEADIASLPTLEFKLADGGPTVQLPPSQYMLKGKDGKQGGYYLLNIESAGDVDLGGITGMVLGQPLLQNYYVEYDRANKVMAWAPAVPDCAAAIQQQ